MKKIKLYPAPHVEIRIHASDEMVKDYKECGKMLWAEGDEKDCSTCSWNNVEFKGMRLCGVEEIGPLLDTADKTI